MIAERSPYDVAVVLAARTISCWLGKDVLQTDSPHAMFLSQVKLINSGGHVVSARLQGC
jgi:hypothetical protein